MAGKARDPKQRFFEKVHKTNYCWEWTASTYYNGYGQFFDGKNKITAHRFSYKSKYGEIDPNILVCHRCDNRKCVNPDHLFLGTHLDNTADMIQKGRKINADKKGTLNGRAIVSESKVCSMRDLYGNGVSIAKIARLFSISETQTSRIVKRQSWKHV